MGHVIDLPYVKKSAENYANRRILNIGKGNQRFKVNQRELKQEIEIASILGELSCLERILTMLQNDPKMDREEFEAQLHIGIVDYNNFITNYVGYGLKLNLDSYLGMRGYFKKPEEEKPCVSPQPSVE